VRLRIEHSGFSTLNNQRFGSKFVGDVSNPTAVQRKLNVGAVVLKGCADLVLRGDSDRHPATTRGRINDSCWRESFANKFESGAGELETI